MAKKTMVEWMEAKVAGDAAILWPYLGPVISSKEVVKEMGGYPIYTNDRQTWLLCVEGGVLVAFGSLATPEKADGTGWMDDAWVREDRRGQGLWTELATRRLAVAARLGFKRVRTCTAKLARPLEAVGFKTTQQRGSWTYMEKELAA